MTETGVTLETTKEQREEWLAGMKITETKAPNLQASYLTTAEACRAIRDIDRLLAEIARLKSRPTSEEVETMATEMDEVRRSQGLTQAGVRAGRAAALLRRLAAQSDGWRAKPEAEWHEDLGPVLWWKFPIEEPLFAGTPFDSDWPGYHTHWTPIPLPSPPSPPSTEDKT